MQNNKSAADLENYSDVLRDVTGASPIVLDIDDSDKYVVMDMREYRLRSRKWAEEKLLAELAKGEASASLTEEEADVIICGL